jgi:hypothetical protein
MSTELAKELVAALARRRMERGYTQKEAKIIIGLADKESVSKALTDVLNGGAEIDVVDNIPIIFAGSHLTTVSRPIQRELQSIGRMTRSLGNGSDFDGLVQAFIKDTNSKSSQRARKYAMSRWQELLSCPDGTDISLASVRSGIKKMRGQKISPRTIMNYVTCLRTFCKWLAKTGVSNENPLANVSPRALINA